MHGKIMCRLKRSVLCKRILPPLIFSVILLVIFYYSGGVACDAISDGPGSNEDEYEELFVLEAAHHATVYHSVSSSSHTAATTPVVHHKLKNEATNATGVAEDPTLESVDHDQFWSLSVSQRVELQQKQVEKFCQLYMFDVKYKLPRSRYQDLILSRHLLVDDNSKTLFCFAPKVGCTNLKLALFYAQGLLTKENLIKARDDIDQEKLEECIISSSFLSRNKPERIEIMKRSFKFIMYRHPLERILSAYRSKIERYPLVGLEKNTPHYNWLRRRIFAHIRPSQYKDWLLHGGRPEVNVSFSDFIDYWLTYDLSSDEHFRTIFSLCEPCRVHYNYYGNFGTFDKDANVLLNRIGGRDGMLRSGYYEDDGSIPTKYLLKQYYEELNLYQKLAVIRKLSLDIDFYYHVFPPEEDTHKHILGIDYDIPRPYY